ncbi:MAG: BrnT family toxin [Candidatus Margulisbacteria bacterium]|jgi:uncharacterized DUF497 family protein|nr:BrnT family toxin [Candidatus Margulisiibacteriota bacterium]
MILGKRFEWDEAKEIANIRRHQVYFEDARLVFNDPFLLIKYDRAHSLEENRYQVLGKIGKLLFVVFTEREKRIRIISARLATKKEKEIYYGQNSKIDTAGWR